MYRIIILSASFGLLGVQPQPTDDARFSVVGGEIEFSGCDVVFAGPKCQLWGTAGTIRLWLPGTTAATITLDGVEATGQVGNIDGGTAYDVEVVGGDRLLVERWGVAPWVLELEHRAPDPVVVEVEDLRRQPSVAAESLLERLETTLPEAPQDLARRISIAARIHRSAGHTERALELLSTSRDIAFGIGALSAYAADAFVAVHTELFGEERDLVAARALLAEVRERAIRDAPSVAAELAYYEGLVALESDDPHWAIGSFSLAMHQARRLNHGTVERTAQRQLAVATYVGGDARGAFDLISDVLESKDGRSTASACSDNAYATWYAMEAAGVGGVPRTAAEIDTEMLQRAKRHALEQLKHCSSRQNGSPLVNAWLDIGLIAVAESDIAAARSALAWVNSSTMTSAKQRVWAMELRARILVASGQSTRAEEVLREIAQKSQDGMPEMALRALVALGRIHLERGRFSAAIEDFDAAERLLESHIAAMGYGEQEARLSDIDAAVVAGSITAHWGLGASERAALVARRARHRELARKVLSHRRPVLAHDSVRHMDEALQRALVLRERLVLLNEERWKLPASQLAHHDEQREDLARQWKSALTDAMAVIWYDDLAFVATTRAADEAHITLFPQSNGWAAVLNGPQGVYRAWSVGDASRATAERLFAEFEPRLQATQRVVLFPTGAMQELALHRVHMGEQPLGLRWPVVYGHDLSPRIRTVFGEADLIAGDPANTLPHARAEATGVHTQLVGSERWLGAEVTPARLSYQLPRTDTFYYAGAASSGVESGGRQGLVLGDGQTWGVTDTLALPEAPRQVILSACRAGTLIDREREDELGLAQAFVARGSQQVIAPTQIVDDEYASAMGVLVSTELARGVSLDVALLRAQRRLQHEGPWWAFQVLSR